MKSDVCKASDASLDAVIPKEAFAIGIISMSLVPLSLFLNGSIILIIASRRRTLGLRSAFTINVCIVNLFLTLFARIPFGIFTFVPSNVLCKMVMMTGHTAVGMSLMALLFLNVERYVAIYHPYKYPNFLRTRNIVTAFILTWSMPWAVEIVMLTANVSSGISFITSATINIALISCLAVMQFRTICTLVKINRETIAVTSRFQAEVDRRCLIRRSKGVRYLTGVMLVLFMCYFPLSLLCLIQKDSIDESSMWINLMAEKFATLPDTLNPICILYSWKEIRSQVLSWPCTRSRDMRVSDVRDQRSHHPRSNKGKGAICAAG